MGALAPLRRRLLHLASLGLALFLFAFTARPGATQSGSGPIYNAANGHYYELVRSGSSINWPNANAGAQLRAHAGQQGHLATLTSWEETQFALTKFHPGRVGSYWLGGRQRPGSTEPAGGWEWITGEPMTYTNWEAREPNNSGGNENAINVVGSVRWNDVREDNSQPGYLVEFEGTPTGPAPIAFQRALVYEAPAAFDITTGDLDGDGFLDLVSPTRASLGILYGKGDGSFEQAVYISVGDAGSIWEWAEAGIADVNRDGRNDIVATHPSADVVLVCLSEGGRTFARAIRYRANDYPHGLVIRDFNKDGWPDLAISNHDSSLFTYLQNRRDGTFTNPVSQGIPGYGGKICSADFNGDSNPDVAAVSFLPGHVYLFFGNGAGSFASGNNYRVGGNGSHSHGITVGDFNGDRKPDIAAGNTFDDRFQVLINQGAGTFDVLPAVLGGSHPHYLQAADMNADGKTDVVIPNRGSSEFSVMLNDGQYLGFSDRWVWDIDGQDTQSLAIGDFNRDGRPDAAVTGYQSGTISVFLNTTGSSGGGGTPPTRPDNLAVTPLATDRLRVDWQDRSNDEQGFHLERSVGTGAFQLLATLPANSATHTDSTGTPNTRYRYRIRAFAGTLQSAFTDPVEALTFAAAPADLQVLGVSQTSVDLRWRDPNTPTVTTELEGSTDGGSTFTVVGTASPSTDPGGLVHHTHTGLMVGRTYQYRVRGRNATGVSANSATVNVTLLPGTPTDLQAVNATQTTAELEWRDTNSPTVSTEVERSDDGGTTFAQVGAPGPTSDPGGVVRFTNTGLLPGRMYHYRTRARNATGVSPYTATLPVTTLVSPPPIPAGVTATVLTASLIELTWADAGGNETGYVIERKAGGAKWGMAHQAGPDVTLWNDTSVTPGTEYRYRVRSRNAGGMSGPSSEAGATIPVGGVVSVSPTTLKFGTLAAGRNKVLTLRISNRGRGPLAGRVGAGDPPFRILSGGGPFTLAPRASVSVRVEYAPGTAGTHAGALAITCTDPAHATTTVALSGRRR